jgi:hypothetical protein
LSGDRPLETPFEVGPDATVGACMSSILMPMRCKS